MNIGKYGSWFVNTELFGSTTNEEAEVTVDCRLYPLGHLCNMTKTPLLTALQMGCSNPQKSLGGETGQLSFIQCKF